MSKIRRVLQLLHEANLSQREAARAAGVGKTCVSDIASRARAAGLSWTQARELDDDTLQARLHPAPVARSARHLEPDWSELHQQLKRPGVTLQLLWEEYQLAHDGRGLPIEIYCFSSNKNWAPYESIQADIFDHLLAVAREFDLELFQEPSGNDFSKITGKRDAS